MMEIERAGSLHVYLSHSDEGQHVSHQFHVVDHSVYNVRLAHQCSHVQTAQTQQRCVQK